MQLAMPLSSQEIFPVVTALNQLELSPSHPQGEDMVTDKPHGAEVSIVLIGAKMGGVMGQLLSPWYIALCERRHDSFC